MPSKPSDAVALACARRANYLIHYTRRVARRCPADADKNQVYAGAYVAYVAFFEQQIAELFVGLLAGIYIHPRTTVAPLVMMPTRTVAKTVVAGGRAYVDWLPYDQHLRKRAKAFFVGGEPFGDLGASERRSLERASILRNALAHQSDHSRGRFAEEFTSGRALRPGEQNPGGYLRGQHSINKDRFQAQLEELVAVLRGFTS